MVKLRKMKKRKNKKKKSVDIEAEAETLLKNVDSAEHSGKQQQTSLLTETTKDTKDLKQMKTEKQNPEKIQSCGNNKTESNEIELSNIASTSKQQKQKKIYRKKILSRQIQPNPKTATRKENSNAETSLIEMSSTRHRNKSDTAGTKHTAESAITESLINQSLQEVEEVRHIANNNISKLLMREKNLSSLHSRAEKLDDNALKYQFLSTTINDKENCNTCCFGLCTCMVCCLRCPCRTNSCKK